MMLPEPSNDSKMPAKSLELKHTIKLIGKLDSKVSGIESEIKKIMNEGASPILTISGINFRMSTVIPAEIGDFSLLDSPDRILAYASTFSATWQSDQMNSSYSHMEKRGSNFAEYLIP